MSDTINDNTEIRITPQIMDIKLFFMRCEKPDKLIQQECLTERETVYAVSKYCN